MARCFSCLLGLAVCVALLAAPGPVFSGGDKDKKDGSLDLKKLEELQKELEKARKELKKEADKATEPPPPLPGGPDRGLNELQMRMKKALEALGRRPGIGGIGGLGGLPLPLPMPKGAPAAPGRLGVSLGLPSDVVREQLGLEAGKGVVVTRVTAGTPAANAGLKVSDIIIEFAGQPVDSDVEKFKRTVEGTKGGTPVDVRILRKGKEETLKGLTLPEAKAPRRLDVSAPGTTTITRTVNDSTTIRITR